MTNTPFSKQVDIVAEYFLEGQDEEGYGVLVASFDLGFPLAFAIHNGGLDENALTDKGREWISEAFLAILNEYGVDRGGDYDSFDEILLISDNDEQG